MGVWSSIWWVCGRSEWVSLTFDETQRKTGKVQRITSINRRGWSFLLYLASSPSSVKAQKQAETFSRTLLLTCFDAVLVPEGQRSHPYPPGEDGTIIQLTRNNKTHNLLAKKLKFGYIPSHAIEVGFYAEHRMELRVTTVTGALPPPAHTRLSFASMFSGAII